MKKYLAVLLLLTSSVVHSLDNPTYYQIKGLHIWNLGNVNVWLEEPADHGCSTVNPRKFMLEVDAPGFEQKVSLLLMSKASGVPVMLGYDCDGSNAVINIIRS